MANYLYNGVELPDISSVYTPEVQKKYPYACLIYFDPSVSGGGSSVVYHYRLFAFTKKVEISNYAFAPLGEYGASHWSYYPENTPMQWEFVLSSDAARWTRYTDVFWTNFKLLRTDGTLYLDASDPIPVGGESIDQASFLQGWLVGRRLAGMRK